MKRTPLFFNAYYYVKLFTLLLTFCLMACSSDTDELETKNNLNLDIQANSFTPNAGSGTSPNVLLIIADDMGMDATPYATQLASQKPIMPNLTSLYQSGVRFENAWAYPTCTPTRGSIITGKHGRTTHLLSPGDDINSSETILQKFINDHTGNAYSTSVFGKWHLSDDSNTIESMGMDTYKGTLSGGVPNYYNGWTLAEDGTNTSMSNYYTTTAFTDYAINWISGQTQPWFCWVAYNAAHTPFHNPTDSNTYSTTSAPSGRHRQYLRMLEAMDYEIGRLVNSMDAATKANTTIIFIGDNGTPRRVAQSPFTGGNSKGSLHSGGVNVPLVVSGYGVNRQDVSETALVQSTDLYATIADICGVTNHDIHESISFKDLLSTSGTHSRNYNFSEKANGDYTIRNDEYKLNVKNGVEYFYDVTTDYDESSNLFNGTLSNDEQTAYNNLKAEYTRIQSL